MWQSTPLEGHVLVIVDTSPSVMILPATFSSSTHAEDLKSPPIGFFQRWVHYLGLFALWVYLYLLFYRTQLYQRVYHFSLQSR